MKYPFHAISNVDYFGEDPHKSGMPRIEEDLSTLDECIRFLADHGGGAVEHFVAGKYRRVQNVNPCESGEATMALSA
jgi:hypothetical protein